MWKVVLGGGLAAGKSTVAAMMRQQGAVVSDLDALAVEVRNLPQVASLLAHEFGDDILDDQGRPIASVLAARAFADQRSTAALNNICHPRIAQMAHRFLQDATGDEVRVLEVPLLVRAADLREAADEVVVVLAGTALRSQRAVDRGMDAQDAARRIASQADDDALRTVADTVIVNDGTVEQLRGQVRDWWGRAVARSRQNRPRGL